MSAKAFPMLACLRLCALFGMLAPWPFAALADWPNDDPTKWVQYPQITNGLNVLATQPIVLADDFLCTTSGPITDIHIWGSWRQDQIFPAPGFILSFWSDVPTNQSNPFSHPGTLLWQTNFFPGTYIVSNWGPTVNEQFFDPVSTNILGPEFNLVQYNFDVDPAFAFVQQESNVYWLAVTALGFDTNQFLFGWKTSTNHWNDDAVYLDTEQGVWNELRYPLGHPQEFQSIDLAFALTTVPEPGSLGLFLVALMGVLAMRRRRIRE